MSGHLNAFTENASRLGMRLQETISERTKDFGLGRGGGTTVFDTGDDKVKNIRAQLDSSSDREKLDAMKRLIAMISKGRSVSEFFAQVVKNVAVSNLEVRKLVYIYLLRYAEAEPDLALLSINTFQRDLSDSSPLIRAMALRVLSGIRVPTIGSLVVLAIKKCSSDVSPYVRKTAALAIPKCYSLDASHLPSLIEILSILLRDRSPLSIGSVAVAFEAVCPTRLDLLHPHYRRLCRVLVDVDEWGQVNLLELLVRYARNMLPRPSSTDIGDGKSKDDVDKDLDLLLSSAEPLFQSRNPAVVLSVSRAFYYLALPSEHHKIVQPMLRLLDGSREIERVALAYILFISRTSPNLFSPHYIRFTIRADDSAQVKVDKIRLLRSFVNIENYQALSREFVDYADDFDEGLAAGAVQAIGHTARVIPEAMQHCLNALLGFIKSRHDTVVTNAVLVLKSLVHTQLQAQSSFAFGASSSPLTIIERLAYRIDEIRHPQARACVVWLVGQYAADATQGDAAPVEGITPWAPDVLRKCAKSFRDETVAVKLQTITLAAKLIALSPNNRTLVLLAKYAFGLARYDRNYDVRDRARVLQMLLGGVVPSLVSKKGEDEEDALEDRGGVVLRREQVRVVLFEGKAGVAEDGEYNDDRELLGTLTLLTGHDMRGDRILPDWLEQGVMSSLRDTEDDTPAPHTVPAAIAHYARAGAAASGAASPIVVLTPAGSSGPSPAGSIPNKAAFTDLEAFYASEDEESDEDESEEEGEGSDEKVAHGTASSEDEYSDEEEDDDDESALVGGHR
ncbi:hypothetical protein FA95DRAFT_973714 [Auriscalpium vulgare]|uniref:Uncharacterized protein n=1 Tax=Auriscalpium vulgare TaxID=40419 RepID=A0ACB8RZE1_9AGAM|nr:hypothetical protein FA95DRAFT_973714 [Auriscalpium vulgare]